jgi:hypothetical protein
MFRKDTGLFAFQPAIAVKPFQFEAVARMTQGRCLFFDNSAVLPFRHGALTRRAGTEEQRVGTEGPPHSTSAFTCAWPRQGRVAPRVLVKCFFRCGLAQLVEHLTLTQVVPGSTPASTASFRVGVSSVGRVLDCDSKGHRFDPGTPTHLTREPQGTRRCIPPWRNWKRAGLRSQRLQIRILPVGPVSGPLPARAAILCGVFVRIVADSFPHFIPGTTVCPRIPIFN